MKGDGSMGKKMRKNSSVDNRAYKFRLHPTDEQIVLFCKTMGCARFIYNHLLDDRTKFYQTEKKTLQREVTYYKEIKEFSFLKEVDSLALANAKLNLDRAFANFFEKKSKYPTFKKKGKRDSYTTNAIYNGDSCNIEIVQSGIKLPKVGIVKTKLHRKVEGKIKSCTISKTAGKFYISIITEIEKQSVEKLTCIDEDKVLGIDFSVPHFAVDSNGTIFEYPRFYRRMQKKLAKEQRRLDSKQYHSNNYYKQLLKVQKISAHIANQRRDFCHQLSRKLVMQYDVICFENLNLSNLKRTLNFGKSINDEGFGMFRNFIQYKLEREGKHFVKIDKMFPSSKLCSVCGYKNVNLTLKDRDWKCPVCNTEHDRDYNAAVNIKQEGLRLLSEHYNLSK
jgi:putative transposase